MTSHWFLFFTYEALPQFTADKYTRNTLFRLVTHPSFISHQKDGFRYLKDLRFFAAYGLVDSELLENIGRHFRNLVELNLSHCESLGDIDFMGLCRVTTLKVLDLRECQSVTSYGMSRTLRHMTKLSRLDISNCKMSRMTPSVSFHSNF